MRQLPAETPAAVCRAAARAAGSAHAGDTTGRTRLAERDWFRRLDAALAELPQEQQTVFVLADIQELSYEEVSRIEGIQMGTVKSRLNRARQKLRALLIEE